MTLAILLPAAGASSRMGGRDKLMEEVDGQPLLARQAARAVAAGLPVYVALRADRPARHAALAGMALHRIIVRDPDEGLSASLRAGVAALPAQASGLIVLLPDLPEIDTPDICRIVAAHEAAPDRILRATAEDGRPGHPVLFPARHFEALTQLAGDAGAQLLLKREGFTPVPLPGARAVTDLDTPQDWARWRAGRR